MNSPWKCLLFVFLMYCQHSALYSIIKHSKNDGIYEKEIRIIAKIGKDICRQYQHEVDSIRIKKPIVEVLKNTKIIAASILDVEENLGCSVFGDIPSLEMYNVPKDLADNKIDIDKLKNLDGVRLCFSATSRRKYKDISLKVLWAYVTENNRLYRVEIVY
jgi:hypothetical protein